MKVAFVGKGGSGKSTIASLFALYLIEQKKKVLLVDADLNIHIPEILNTSQKEIISTDKNMLEIRKILAGTNPNVDPLHFIKTTPPGMGSTLISISDENEIIKRFTAEFNGYGRLMVVGTYQEDGIGTSCYHTNLGILENILSHTQTKTDEWVVVDMVAGIDAFANSLHLQFDCLFFVCEPTSEGVSVFKRYQTLAKDAGVENQLLAVGNKVEDETDSDFLKKGIGEKLISMFDKEKKIKQARQSEDKVTLKLISGKSIEVLEKMLNQSQKLEVDPNVRLRQLHSLHLKLGNEKSTKLKHGDLSGQIDETFVFI